MSCQSLISRDRVMTLSLRDVLLSLTQTSATLNLRSNRSVWLWTGVLKGSVASLIEFFRGTTQIFVLTSAAYVVSLKQRQAIRKESIRAGTTSESEVTSILRRGIEVISKSPPLQCRHWRAAWYSPYHPARTLQLN